MSTHYPDINKNFDGYDDNFCGIATACNMLAYGGYAQLAGFTDENDLFSSAQECFAPKSAIDIYYFLRWFFTGAMRTEFANNQISEILCEDGGGCLPGVNFNGRCLSVPPFEWIMFPPNSFVFGVGVLGKQKSGSWYNHALTVYGYEVDNKYGFDPRSITAMWYVDSDDEDYYDSVEGYDRNEERPDGYPSYVHKQRLRYNIQRHCYVCAEALDDEAKMKIEEELEEELDDNVKGEGREKLRETLRQSFQGDEDLWDKCEDYFFNNVTPTDKDGKDFIKKVRDKLKEPYRNDKEEAVKKDYDGWYGSSKSFQDSTVNVITPLLMVQGDDDASHLQQGEDVYSNWWQTIPGWTSWLKSQNGKPFSDWRE